MEEMALESLVASVWKLEGYLTVIRHPIRVTGGYSDIDVLGLRGGGYVRLAECKARGPARAVNIEGGQNTWTAQWDDSLANAGRIWESPPPWLPLADEVTSLEFHLVGNVWFVDDSAQQRAESRLTRALREQLPRRLRRRAVALVSPSAKLLTKAMHQVRQEIVSQKWGRRYGDPLLDALRELVRYAHPLPAGARGVRRSIRGELRDDLLSAIFGDADESDRS
jgi:hypothetical protein